MSPMLQQSDKQRRGGQTGCMFSLLVILDKFYQLQLNQDIKIRFDVILSFYCLSFVLLCALILDVKKIQ